MAFEYAVALTGGIATGKSTIAAMLKEKGYCVIDADTIAHEVLDRSHQKIAEIFGSEYIEAGKVNRKALGALVFADKKQRSKLEALVHPLIFEEIRRRAEEMDRQERLYFIDIPLFFETKRYPIERSLLVYAPKEQQLKRLILRDGYNRQHALARIESQMPIDEKRKKATLTIDNSGDLTQLEAECNRTIKELQNDSNKILG